MTMLMNPPTGERPPDEGMQTTDEPRCQPHTKRIQLCQQLQRMILGGRYRAGERLGQDAIGKQFGVAQGVVREALIQLTQFGLVESFDRRGAYVARLDGDRVLEALELRAMHEALAVRLCCERVTRLEVREVMAAIEQIHELGIACQTRRMHAHDRQLHKRLIELSGNSMLMRLADNYWLLIRSLRDDRNPGVVRDEHRAIAQAIQSGDADAAEKFVRQHVAALRDGLAGK